MKEAESSQVEVTEEVVILIKRYQVCNVGEDRNYPTSQQSTNSSYRRYDAQEETNHFQISESQQIALFRTFLSTVLQREEINFLRRFLGLYNFFVMATCGIIFGVVFRGISELKYTPLSLSQINSLIVYGSMLIALMSLLVVVAVFGFRERRSQRYKVVLLYLMMLLFAFTVLATLWCILVSFGIWRTEEGAIKENLINLLQNSSSWKAWDVVHERFKCCGVVSYRDWAPILSQSRWRSLFYLTGNEEKTQQLWFYIYNSSSEAPPNITVDFKNDDVDDNQWLDFKSSLKSKQPVDIPENKTSSKLKYRALYKHISYKRSLGRVPNSCCRAHWSCEAKPRKGTVYTKGCHQYIYNKINHTYILYITSVTVLLFLIASGTATVGTVYSRAFLRASRVR